MSTHNEYLDVLARGQFESTPKTVLAAIAVSFALRISDEDFAAVADLIATEWQALHVAGIVPQAPIRKARG